MDRGSSARRVTRTAPRLLTLALGLALLLGPAAPAGADTMIDIPYTEVVEKYNDGGNCAYYRYYLQISEVEGASRYTALNRYHGGGFILRHSGPPFPDDDEQGQGFHFTAPPGTHRWGATAGSGPGPCTDSVKDEWEPDYVRAHFVDFKVTGTAKKPDGSPAAGVTIKITGPGSDTVTTGADGTYSSKKLTVEGDYTVEAAGAYCAAGVNPCSNRRTVTLPPNGKVDFVGSEQRISGHVYGLDGHPAEPGLTVTATGPTTRTATIGADGSYEIPVDPGVYAVTPSGKGGEFQPQFNFVDVSAGPATADFAVGFRVSGRAEERTCLPGGCTRQPVAGVKVEAEPAGPGTGRSATTQPDGTWSMLLGPGDYTLDPSDEEDSTWSPTDRPVSVHGPIAEQNFGTCAQEGPPTENAAKRVTAAGGEPCPQPDGIDWTMPPRLDDRSPKGWHGDEVLPLPRELYPKQWTADLFLTTGKHRYKCLTGFRWRWKVDLPKGTKVVGDKPKPGCESVLRVNALDTYPVTAIPQELKKGKWVDVKAKKQKPLKQKVRVRDLLLLGMGDSNGSGEGNAPFYFERCNRSLASYQYRTAQFVEDQDDRTSVSFIFTSCSGASVQHLVDKTFEGTRSQSPDLDPQIEQINDRLVRSGAKPRKVDAALLSVGVNNLSFGGIMQFCVKHPANALQPDFVPCQDRRVRPDAPVQRFRVDYFRDDDDGIPLADYLRRFQRQLPDRFPSLATALEAKPERGGLGVSGSKVFLAAYPDFAHDETGAICDTRAFTPRGEGALARFAPSTWEWMSLAGSQLNTTMRRVSRENKWTATPTSPVFLQHGYCAGDSLFTGIAESAGARDLAGPFHPDSRAHLLEAALTEPLVCKKLFKDERCKSKR